MTKPPARRALCAAAVLLVSCGTRDTPGAASPGGGTAASRPTATGAPAASPCVLAALWQSCYVEKQLENSGLIPTLLDSAVALPMFAPKARHYRLGRGELYVILYADSAARAADLASLDSVTVTRRGAPAYAWPVRPYLVTSRNAAAVLLTTSEHLTVRIDDIFSAGLPALMRR